MYMVFDGSCRDIKNSCVRNCSHSYIAVRTCHRFFNRILFLNRLPIPFFYLYQNYPPDFFRPSVHFYNTPSLSIAPPCVDWKSGTSEFRQWHSRGHSWHLHPAHIRCGSPGQSTIKNQSFNARFFCVGWHSVTSFCLEW